MAFPVATRRRDVGHDVLHCPPAFPALSSNRPLKKYIPPLEILSETADDTDAGFVSEATEYSLCTSPTCTKESSSDEGAKLLVQPFGSSENPLVYGKARAKGSPGIVGASNGPHSNQSSAMKPAPEKTARIKVSFQEKAESCVAAKRSSTEMHRQKLEFSVAEVGARRSVRCGSTANHGKLTFEADVQQPPPCASPHTAALSSNHCSFPSVSSRAADFLHRCCSHTLLKLRGFMRHQQQEGEVLEDDGGLIQGHRLQADTSMDDVNEMKALLNTINQNLKMLETRSKAHPQLLSSKLAPVYFTT